MKVLHFLVTVGAPIAILFKNCLPLLMSQSKGNTLFTCPPSRLSKTTNMRVFFSVLALPCKNPFRVCSVYLSTRLIHSFFVRFLPGFLCFPISACRLTLNLTYMVCILIVICPPFFFTFPFRFAQTFLIPFVVVASLCKKIFLILDPPQSDSFRRAYGLCAHASSV